MEQANLLDNIVKKIMTSNVDGITTMPNAEIEDKEMVKTPDGEVYEAEGERHEDGGIKVNLEDKTRILTDRGKPNSFNRKLVKEMFDIKVDGKKDSFSDVLRKIERKIGINKLEDEQLAVAEKVKKNLKTEDENTKNLNDQYYSEKYAEIEGQKAELEQTKSEAYDLLYHMQESQKTPNDTYYDQETDIYVKRAAGGEIVFPKSEKDKVIKYAQENNISNPADLIAIFTNKFEKGGMVNSGLPKFVEGAEFQKTQAQKNKEYGTNALSGNKALGKWDTGYYKALNDYLAANGIEPQTFKEHKDYQNYIATNFGTQLEGLYKNDEIPLTNKHRALLKASGVSNFNNKTKWSDLTEVDRAKLSNNFIKEGYVDNIAGSRGINFLPGEMTKEEYTQLQDQYKGSDKMPLYGQYGEDKKIKRTQDAPTFYYPKPTAPVIPPAEKADTAKSTELDTTVRRYKPLATPFNAMPAQYDMYPSALRLPSLIVPPTREMSYMRVSPEQALQENARAYGAIQDRVMGTPDGAQSAVMSDIAGKMFKSNADAIANANQQNIGIRTNFDQMDTQYRSNMDLNRANALANYGRLADQAVLNTSNDWRDYYKSRNMKDLLAYKDMQTMSMAEAMTPDVNYNPYLRTYEYNNPNIYLGNTIPQDNTALYKKQVLESIKAKNKKG